jgi:biopolymer transport protein ExbB/TolQ
MTLWNWFIGGGTFMFFILAISIFAFLVIIYKTYFLYFKYRIAEDEVTQAIIRNVETDNISRAIQYCNVKDHPMTAIMKAGLTRANKPEKEIRRAMEVAAADEVPNLKKFTNVLPHLANLSTLLGLLGTIRGLIIAFKGIEGGSSVERAQVLSKGISVAFTTTFFGLLIAVPIIIAYLILSGRFNKIMAKIEYGASALVDSLVTKNKKGAAR